MPLFVFDGKTAEDIASFLNIPTHAGINHSGLPGVGDLTTAAHSALNHAGLPGVGDLTAAAHALINHAGLPGVGVDGIRVVDNTVNESSLQAILNDASVRWVFLKPGTYNLGANVQLQVPADKALIGLGGTFNRDQIAPAANAVVFQTQSQGVGGGAYVTLQDRARLANVSFVQSGNGGSNSGYCVTALNGAQIENVLISGFMQGGTTTGAAVLLDGGCVARNVLVYDAKNHGFRVTNGDWRGPAVLEHCTAYSCDGEGFELSNACMLFACAAIANTLNGFKGQNFCVNQKLTNCVAENNSQDGFNWTNSSGGDGTTILGCSSVSNSQMGYDLTAASGGRPAVVGSSARANVVGGNAAGFGNITGWQNFANWVAS